MSAGVFHKAGQAPLCEGDSWKFGALSHAARFRYLQGDTSQCFWRESKYKVYFMLQFSDLTQKKKKREKEINVLFL